MMLQRGGRGVKKKEGRGGLLHLLEPTESTSHSARAAGGKARESERGREGAEHERRERRDRVCACLCVRAWIAPLHPVHRFCRRPCSDGENKPGNLFFFLRFISRPVVPDVTVKPFYDACIESRAVHLGETVTPWLWLWNL